jgi:hypothetical protein
VEDLLGNGGIYRCSIPGTPLHLQELPDFIYGDTAILADVNLGELLPQLVDDPFIFSFLL